MIGKVVKVFVPEEEQDIMNSTKIGFNVLVDGKIIEIIEEQDDYNCTILREDYVKVIDNKIYKLEDE